MASNNLASTCEDEEDNERQFGTADLSAWKWFFIAEEDRAKHDAWKRKAKCRGHGDMVKLFVPSTGEDLQAKHSRADTNAAKRVCNGQDGGPVCPVRERCLTYARQFKIEEGVWGGMSGTARSKLPPLTTPG